MRLLFYILPALMDITVGLFFFVSAKRMADSGANSYMVALTMTTWAVCYAVSSFLSGYIITRRNATRILLASQAILLAALGALAATESLTLQYLWLMGTGIGGALFFTAFQPVTKLFFKEEHALEAMVRNSALYTFSWSTGLALGPFIAAFVWGLFDAATGWRSCYLIAIGFQLIVTAGLIALAVFVRRRLAAEDEASATAAPAGNDTPSGSAAGAVPPARRELPDLMAAGWLLQGIGYIAVAMMRTYLPDYCTRVLAMSTFHQGIVMAVVSFAQALAGLACITARRWPYRPWTVGAVSMAAAGAFLVFAFASSWQCYVVAAVLLGVFSGMMCFTATFHALIDPVKTARYAAVNESLVGLGSMAAPLLGGLLATRCHPLAPFFCCLGCLLLCAILYGGCTWKYRSLR